MCGVFGFASNSGYGPDTRLLRQLAIATEIRGSHAFGLAWIDRDGRLTSYKTPGPASQHVDALDACRDAVAVIGHCRWATHGAPEVNRNNHPHAAGTGLFVHNGVVPNYETLLLHYDLEPQTQCDSEVFGLLMRHAGGSLIQRAVWAMSVMDGSHAILGLWASPPRMLVLRRGRPLHVGAGPNGHYLASLPTGLPGRPQPVPDNTVRLFIATRHAQHANDRVQGDMFQAAQ